MYETLSELLLMKGLYQIDALDLLALPESQDGATCRYLSGLLSAAVEADNPNESADEEGCDAGGVAVAYRVCAELERLWDEGITLLSEDCGMVDAHGLWRMLVMLPIYFIDDADEEDGDEPEGDASIQLALQDGFALCRNVPLQDSEFEAVLVAMPNEIIYDFLTDLDDEARLVCLMRLALAEEGWLFQIDEDLVRDVLNNGGSVVRNSMLQLLGGLGVEFTLEEGAPCDAAWAEACQMDCDCCMGGVCVCEGGCGTDNCPRRYDEGPECSEPAE